MIGAKTKGSQTLAIGRQPVVPYADDGPKSRAILEEITSWRASVSDEDFEKKLGELGEKLRTARYEDMMARRRVDDG